MGGSRIMYLPDGRRLLAASAYGISIYNTDTGQALINIAADEESSFGDVIYAPDGKRIAALYGPRNNRAIKIFDTESGQELRAITVNGNFSNVVYSPDGKNLLTRYRDSNRNYIVKILDAETGRELRTLPIPDYQFAYSPDGRRIVSVPSDAYGEDGKLLFAGSWATVWDASNGRKLITLGYGPLNTGARAYMDLQVARFLGDTAAAGRHEGILQFITGRGNVSRAEIQQYLIDGIKNIVDTEYNKRSFELRTGNKAYDVLLTRNPNNNSYTVHYSRYLENDDEEFTSPNLDALLAELKKRGFTSDNCVTVRRESGLFPAVQRISGVTDNDTIELIKYLLTDFYTTNNQTTILNDYKALLAIFNRYDNLYENNGKSDVVLSAINAMGSVLIVLSPELSEVFGRDLKNIIAASQRLSQQARASLMSKLMSNNIEVLAVTVGEVEVEKRK
jgi:hypothetical protein